MFHTYQTKEDIRRIILRALIALDRPADAHTIGTWIFNRSLIDGTRCCVLKTVRHETRSMRANQLLRVDSHEVEGNDVYEVYAPHDPLTTIAILTAD